MWEFSEFKEIKEIFPTLPKFSNLPTLPKFSNLPTLPKFSTLPTLSFPIIPIIPIILITPIFHLCSLLFHLSQKQQSGVVHHYSRLFYILAKILFQHKVLSHNISAVGTYHNAELAGLAAEYEVVIVEAEHLVVNYKLNGLALAGLQ